MWTPQVLAAEDELALITGVLALVGFGISLEVVVRTARYHHWFHKLHDARTTLARMRLRTAVVSCAVQLFLVITSFLSYWMLPDEGPGAETGWLLLAHLLSRLALTGLVTLETVSNQRDRIRLEEQLGDHL